MSNEKTHLEDEVSCRLYGKDGKLKDLRSPHSKDKQTKKKQSLLEELREVINILFS